MDTVTEAASNAWTMIDLLLAVGLGLSIIVGLWRGLVTEMLSLAGWGVAYFASQWLGASAGAMLPVDVPGSKLNVIAGMVVVFVLVWLAWALLSWAVVQVVRASALSGPDRLMGAVFGLMRGVLVALIIVTLVSMTPLTKWQPWAQSRGVAWLQVALEGLRPMLPVAVSQYLPVHAPPVESEGQPAGE